MIGHDSGTVVPASAALLLALTTLLTVLTPLGALFSRRFVQTIEEESGGPRPARAPREPAGRGPLGKSCWQRAQERLEMSP